MTPEVYPFFGIKNKFESAKLFLLFILNRKEQDYGKNLNNEIFSCKSLYEEIWKNHALLQQVFLLFDTSSLDKIYVINSNII